MPEPLLRSSQQRRYGNGVRRELVAIAAAAAAVVCLTAMSWSSLDEAPTTLLGCGQSPCVPVLPACCGTPPLWAGDPMGPDVDRLAAEMKKLNGELGHLNSKVREWGKKEKSFARMQNGDLDDMSSGQHRAQQAEEWEDNWMSLPGPPGKGFSLLTPCFRRRGSRDHWI